MLETFLALLTAHLVADFPLQPDWLIRRKRNPLILLLHAALVVATAVLALGAWPVWPLSILLATHLAMDAVKVFYLKDTLKTFAIDQAFHLIVIAAMAIGFPRSAPQGWWRQLQPEGLSAYFAGLCLLSGLIASLQVGAIVIRKATNGFTLQVGDDIQGLSNGGLYIGCLERALVMLLILMDQAAGVGFLITAKSILRFGDVKESSQRKLTEYIIIGTFMSFGWGLLIAVLTQLGVRHWLAQGQPPARP